MLKCHFYLNSETPLEVYLQRLQEIFGNLEAAVSHTIPEIKIHLSLMILQWHIADDAE